MVVIRTGITAMDLIGTVIPCHNRRDVTLMCLERLYHIERSGFDHRIYVVDDGSTDGTGEAIRQRFGDSVRIIDGSGDLFWTAAINKGIESAISEGCEYVHLMNDDVSFLDDFLARLYRTAKENGGLSVVGSVTCDIEDRNKVLRAGVRWDPGKVNPWMVVRDCSLGELVEKGVDRVDTLSGRSVLLPERLIRELGYFDARRFPHSFADLDYFFRARDRGYSILADPKSLIYTRVENKLAERLLTRGTLAGISDLWLNVHYFGMRTVWYMSRYTRKRLRYLLADILRKCKWTLLRACLDDRKFRSRMGR